MPVTLLAVMLAFSAPVQEAVHPPHPGFTLPTVDGGSGSLADHLGRKSVVFHFASW